MDNFWTSYLESVDHRLRSDDRKTRSACLDDIKLKLASEGYHPSVCKPLLNSFHDKAELCRQKAAHQMLTILENESIPEPQAVSLLLSICRRIGGTEMPETSEEIHLLLLKILHILLTQGNTCVSRYVPEVVTVIKNGLDDPYPDVKRESCECSSELAEKFSDSFQRHSEEIVKSILVAAKHKHFRIRVSAINALAQVVPHSTSDGIKLACGSMGECFLDQNYQVRYAVFKTVSQWLLRFREKYTYHPHILPLMLTSLGETNEENYQEVSEAWHQIGLQHIEENKDTLQDQHDYLPQTLEVYPENQRRPNLGCRVLVRNNVGKIFPALLNELEDWKVEVRVRASELLKIIALHLESYVAPFLDKLLPVMFRTCITDELTVAQNVISCADLMGYFVPPNVYWHLFESRLNDWSLGHCVILASIVKHTNDEKLQKTMPSIVQLLHEDQLHQNHDSTYQSHVLAITQKLIRCITADAQDLVTFNIYSILMSVVKTEDQQIRTSAKHQLDILSSKCSTDLHEKYLPTLLERLEESCSVWESFSTDFKVFVVLVRDFTNELLKFALVRVKSILEILFAPSSEKEVAFIVLLTIAKVLENSVEMSTEAVSEIINGPLKLQLVWRCGKTVEVMRATAVTIVSLYLRKTDYVAPNFVHEMTPLVLGLCEDNYKESRLKALSALSGMAKLQCKQNTQYHMFVQTVVVVAGRLNDESDDVRVLAIATLEEIVQCESDTEIARSPGVEDLSKAVQLIFANVEDKNTKIRDMVLKLLGVQAFMRLATSVVPDETMQKIIRRYPDEHIFILLKESLKLGS